MALAAISVLLGLVAARGYRRVSPRMRPPWLAKSYGAFAYGWLLISSVALLVATVAWLLG